ncbi:helix-turn-helix domain-containing protein [Nocardioides sp. QY071]|uniref:helix-turn-helix domain-containing protein n=1 Tax=Nocardioides sp. QY071 TaxID=3044187 RepID=UPI00249BD911|nr:helix-turn-helix domain-containing protein [Nocardioides sp. QY071]WGY02019.1 helix-turn-helix domain-containing protein [Nocardioides sp. QY071]
MRWTPDGPLDVVEPAALRDVRGFAPSLRRYAPPPSLADAVRRFWVPVWSLPPGETSVQRVLQYPVCQVVVGPDGAQLVGPHAGLSTEELSGSGWVVGAMMQPAAGLALVGGPVAELTNQRRPLASVAGLDAAGLVGAVAEALGDDPAEVARQQEACALVAEALAVLVPVDDEGRLVNAIVEYIEGEREVQRVSQVCEKFDIGERTLQRLTRRRIGLSPKWLVQRRRLHDAADLLRAGERVDLARVAVELGYADQAHLTRDFRAVTGVTPGEFSAEPAPEVEEVAQRPSRDHRA